MNHEHNSHAKVTSKKQEGIFFLTILLCSVNEQEHKQIVIWGKKKDEARHCFLGWVLLVFYKPGKRFLLLQGTTGHPTMKQMYDWLSGYSTMFCQIHMVPHWSHLVSHNLAPLLILFQLSRKHTNSGPAPTNDSHVFCAGKITGISSSETIRFLQGSTWSWFTFTPTLKKWHGER